MSDTNTNEKKSLDDLAIHPVLELEKNGGDVLQESDYTEEDYKRILRKIVRHRP